MPKQLIKYATGLEEALDFAPLSITELYTFVNHLVAGETPQIVALGTRRTVEWVNSLDFDCYLALAKQFIRENFPKAMKIAEADPIAGLKVGPLLLQMGRMLSLLPSSSAPGASSSTTPGIATTPGAASPSAPGPTAAPAATTPPSAATPPAGSAGT